MCRLPKITKSNSDLVNLSFIKLGWKSKECTQPSVLFRFKKIRKNTGLLAEGPRTRKKLKASGLTQVIISISNFAFLKKSKAWNSQKGYNLPFNETIGFSRFPATSER